MINVNDTAANLAHAWRGTDPMHSLADVARAVRATGEIAGEDVLAVVDALVPLLRRDGTLLRGDAARTQRETAAAERLSVLDSDWNEITEEERDRRVALWLQDRAAGA